MFFLLAFSSFDKYYFRVQLAPSRMSHEGRTLARLTEPAHKAMTGYFPSSSQYFSLPDSHYFPGPSHVPGPVLSNSHLRSLNFPGSPSCLCPLHIRDEEQEGCSDLPKVTPLGSGGAQFPVGLVLPPSSHCAAFCVGLTRSAHSPKFGSQNLCLTGQI